MPNVADARPPAAARPDAASVGRGEEGALSTQQQAASWVVERQCVDVRTREKCASVGGEEGALSTQQQAAMWVVERALSSCGCENGMKCASVGGGEGTVSAEKPAASEAFKYALSGVDVTACCTWVGVQVRPRGRVWTQDHDAAGCAVVRGSVDVVQQAAVEGEQSALAAARRAARARAAEKLHPWARVHV
eukprot:294957-Chlamydomonas_euryale.AAC.1